MSRRPATAAILALALLAGCGGDGDGPTAASFVDCFESPGFTAAKPKPREESILAFQARRNGYGVEAVNVSKSGMLTPHALLVFFASADEAEKAMKELKATSLGEVPPQRRGPAVIGYGDEESRASVGSAVEDCL